MTAAFADESFFRFPLRRLGHGFGHGLLRHVAFHGLLHHGLWTLLAVIAVLVVVGLLIRRIARRRTLR